MKVFETIRFGWFGGVFFKNVFTLLEKINAQVISVYPVHRSTLQYPQALVASQRCLVIFFE